jgi:hypothetical protein
MATNKEICVWRDKPGYQCLRLSFSYQRKSLKYLKILTLLAFFISTLFLGQILLLNPVIGVKLSNFVLCKKFLNMLLSVKRIKFKEWLEIRSCSQHYLFRAARMNFNKFSYVIHTISIGYPYLGLDCAMFLQFFSPVNRQCSCFIFLRLAFILEVSQIVIYTK